MAEDQPAHQSLCESDKNRRRQSYNVEEDAKRLAPGQGIPYRHCNAETPKPGNEPRLFSKHKVKCLISPQDQGRDEDGDEMNIRINGFGDLGLLIETFLAIPRGSKVKYKFYMEEEDNEVIGRVFILLSMAKVCKNYMQTAEAMLHYWYSAFLPDWVLDCLKDEILPMVEDVEETCLLTGVSGDVVETYMRHGHHSGERLEFVNQDLARFQRSHNISGRENDIKKELLAHPKWRSSRMEYLQTGVLLPLTASRQDFKNPNPAFFRDWDSCRDHGFDPMDAWEGVFQPPRNCIVPEQDGHGNFFYFMQEKLTSPPGYLEDTTKWTFQWEGKPSLDLAGLQDPKLSDKSSNGENLTKSEKRKVAKAKRKKALKASKSAKNARENPKPSHEDRSMAQAPDSANDVFPESTETPATEFPKVVVTPSGRLGFSETVERHSHQQLHVTSPPEGREEQERNEQELGQEGTTSMSTTESQDRPAASQLKAVEDGWTKVISKKSKRGAATFPERVSSSQSSHHTSTYHLPAKPTTSLPSYICIEHRSAASMSRRVPINGRQARSNPPPGVTDLWNLWQVPVDNEATMTERSASRNLLVLPNPVTLGLTGSGSILETPAHGTPSNNEEATCEEATDDAELPPFENYASTGEEVNGEEVNGEEVNGEEVNGEEVNDEEVNGDIELPPFEDYTSTGEEEFPSSSQFTFNSQSKQPMEEPRNAPRVNFPTVRPRQGVLYGGYTMVNSQSRQPIESPTVIRVFLPYNNSRARARPTLEEHGIYQSGLSPEELEYFEANQAAMAEHANVPDVNDSNLDE
ncbi:uncharacterized protein PG998_009414 [Apiospora kogelbergensis]|uniref:uncharacterized protein n=1 Tax=Apiospora kogelbergensis TaxID=1337665 RepID=UPI00312F8F03